MSWIYSDFIEIKEDFIAVFTEDIDRMHRQDWKSFISHKRFADILAGLIKAFERGSPNDNMSLWIHGAYGTGKTFAVFVLKHILEDPLEEVEEYFKSNAGICHMWERVKSLREHGKYLVVYRSSSAHIKSTLTLLAEIQQAVANKLRENGYSAAVGETICSRILEKLSPGSPFVWEKAFEKYRHYFTTFTKPEQVVSEIRRIADGENKDPSSLYLVEIIAQILEKEGYVIADTPDTVKRWLKDIIHHHRLRGILFIWDEFSDFFRNNEQVSGLQELAHITKDTEFYFLLVTHRSLEQFQRIDSDTRKRIEERFHNFRFEMMPVTAYQLIDHTIITKKGKENEWEDKKLALWLKVETTVTHVLGEEAKKEDFKAMLPIHPFSAYILSNISTQFSSSQRTLFQFLKNDDPDSFIAFLRTYPKNDWFWFTVDGLWDYFFKEDQWAFADNVRDIVGYYRSRIDSIEQDNAKRVFKVIMLLIALWKQFAGGKEALKPSRENIKLIFQHSPVSDSLQNIIKGFCEKQLVHSIPMENNDEEYMLPMMSVDPKKRDTIKKQTEGNYPFENIVSNPLGLGKELQEMFAPGGGGQSKGGQLKSRVEISCCTSADLKTKKERVLPSFKPYQIGVVIIAALEEGFLPESEHICAELAKQSSRAAYVVVQTPFGTRRLENWIDAQTDYTYCKDIHDETNAAFYENRIKKIQDEWLGMVRQSRNRLYFGTETKEIADSAGYERVLSEYVLVITINNSICSIEIEREKGFNG